ncbi:retrovirus-related Pol polyprotein from transposon 297 [Trichonephila clavipes]|nr:retrovirus-related Pol polyprotein from transposon 297 [Trichonephila clavipes]
MRGDVHDKFQMRRFQQRSVQKRSFSISNHFLKGSRCSTIFSTDCRPVGDYRQLNSVTEFDSYLMPYLNDFAHALHGKRIFSKIDIFKAFHQIPIAECDIPKTAVTTPWGLYEYTHLCFGLVPQTFMRFMHEVLRGLPFCFVYLDDILCYSENAEEHRSHLRTIFQRLSSYGLKLNISKCVFGVTELIFLGHFITPDGIKPLPDKVQAVLDYKQPETVGSLRKFLGLLNFYRRFLPKAAEQQYLLSEFLKGSKGKKDSKPLNWSFEAITAFQRCKQALADAAHLAHPSPSAPLALHVDASDYAIGGALHQVVDSELSFPENLLHLKSLTVPTTVNSLLSTRLSDTFDICWKLEISLCLLTTSPSLMLLGKKVTSVLHGRSVSWISSLSSLQILYTFQDLTILLLMFSLVFLQSPSQVKLTMTVLLRHNRLIRSFSHPNSIWNFLELKR